MKILTAKEVSDLLRAKPSTVYAWAEQGLIPSFKLNGLLRFSDEEIMSWIKGCKKQSEEHYNMITGRRPRKGGQK